MTVQEVKERAVQYRACWCAHTETQHITNEVCAVWNCSCSRYEYADPNSTDYETWATDLAWPEEGN